MTEKDISVYRADGVTVDIGQIDQAFGKWVHTGRNITISHCNEEYVQKKLKEPNVYKITKSIRGRAILISNTGYQVLRLMKDLFTQMSYKISIFTEKAIEEMYTIIRNESKREENKLIDSFVLVIYGTPENFDINEVFKAMKPENAKHLDKKPKLVYVIGGSSIVRQVDEHLGHFNDSDFFVGVTDTILFVENFENDLLMQFASYHTFPASSNCTLTRDFFFFPNASKSVLPDDLTNLELADIQLYRKLLLEGWLETYNIRLMFVGLFGAGKTSTARRIMGKGIDDVTSTDGIDVYIGKCRVDISTNTWETVEESSRSMPLMKLAEQLRDPEPFRKRSDDNSMTQDIGSTETYKRRKLESRKNPSTSSRTSSEFGIKNPDSSTRTSASDTAESFIENDVAMGSESESQTSSMEYLKTAQRVLHEARCTDGENQPKTAIVSLWDFAGQFVYYATHQLFFSPRSVYLLVVNMEEGDLEKPLDEWYMDLTGKDSIEAQGGIHFWLSSIYTYAKGETKGVPPIILVGTHTDKMNGNDKDKEKYARRYFQNIRDIFDGSPISDHIRSEDVLLDNSLEDSNIDQLKEIIISVSEEMFYWGEKIPAKWIELEQALVDSRNDGTNFISMKDFEEINQKLASPLQSEEHLKLFLKIHHQMGTIINFEDTEMLRDIIILEPQWIIHAFRHLIRAKDFSEKYGHLKKQWEEFNNSGKLDIELAENIWKQDLKNHFYENFDILLRFLEKLDIIVRASQLGENGITRKALGFYYVPCLLKEMPPDKVLHLHHIPDGVRTPVLCFTFRETFLPPAIFNRVIALCLARWPVARQGKNTFLYCGCAVFEVSEREDEDRHRLHIFFKNSKIGLRISRYSTKDVKEVDQQVCDRIRRFVAQAIRKEFNRFQNRPTPGMEERLERDPFFFQIQCVKSDAKNVLEDGLHELKELTELLAPKNDTKVADIDAFCSKHCHLPEPHFFKPTDLLKEWFPDEIPKHLRESEETVFESWYKRLPEEKKNLRLQTLKGKILDKTLADLSATIGKNWWSLMHDLGVPQMLIEQHSINNPREVAMSIFEVMRYWVGKQDGSSGPTARQLFEAMFKAKDVTIDWEEVQNIFENLNVVKKC